MHSQVNGLIEIFRTGYNFGRGRTMDSQNSLAKDLIEVIDDDDLKLQGKLRLVRELVVEDLDGEPDGDDDDQDGDDEEEE